MRRGPAILDAPPAPAEPSLVPGPAPGPLDHLVASAQPMQTEFRFTLPRGYVDDDGRTHREGRMRLATARDELVPLRDDRVRENPAYLTVVLLGRVVTELGSLPRVDASVVEDMFASDLAFLQDFYRRINAEGHTLAAVTCPECKHEFAVDVAGGRLGES